MIRFLRRMLVARKAAKDAAAARAPDEVRTERRDDDTVSHSVFVSDNPAQGVRLDEAAAMQQSIAGLIDDASAPVSQKMNAAARLMTAGAFNETIAAYESIMRQHPDRRGDCEGQIGAALFFLGDYEAAIERYRRALDHGADPSMMRDNIEEAEEAIAKRDNG